VSSEVLAAPLVTGGRVLVRTVDGRLHSLDASTARRNGLAKSPCPRLSLRGTAAPVLAKDSRDCRVRLGQGDRVHVDRRRPGLAGAGATPGGRSELDRLADVDGAVQVDGNDGFAVGLPGSRRAMLALDSGPGLVESRLSSYRAPALDDTQVYVATSDGSVALPCAGATARWSGSRKASSVAA
jgi:outer membrane protein assembly factor BamB